MLEILAAITYIRRNSERLHIDPEKIAVMGFSAGGHAACTAGLFWQEKIAEETLGIEHGEDKPNGMILCYPVITSGKYTHSGSMKCLLGDDPDPELLEKMSLEKQVTENAPHAFIWHTSEDGLVPLENSLYIAEALHEKGIDVEMHIYPKGHHGLKAVDSGVASGVNFLALKNGREIISCQYGYRDIENQKPMTTKEFSELIAENDLCFDPGEHFMYGVSADILGALIERTTDMKLGEFMQKELFEPLEMNDTGFYVPAEKADRTAKVYDFIDGHLSEVKTNHLGIKYTLDIPPAFESGGAGICSTLDDYSKFAEMLLGNGNFRGRQIIPEKAVKYMISGGLTDIQKADLQAGWGDLYGYTSEICSVSVRTKARLLFCPSTPLISRSSTPFSCMASICPARSGAASSAKATSRNLMATSPSCFIETMIAQLQKSSLHIAISRMMWYAYIRE